MTSIIIPSRRLERPSYPYELDYNHPLVALDRAGARFYDLATLRSTPPGPFTLVGTSHTHKNDYAGPGYGFTTAPGTTSIPIQPYIKPAVSTTQVTVLAFGTFGRTLQEEAFCSYGYNGTTGYMWNFLKNTADKLRMECRIGSTWYNALSNTVLAMGRNYVCAGRYNNSTIDVFVDGRKDGTTSISGTLSGVQTYFGLLDHTPDSADNYYNGGNAKYVLVLPNAAAPDMVLAEVGRYPWSIVRRKKEVIYSFSSAAPITEAYPIADVSKGAWDNSANLLVGAPTLILPRGFSKETFNPADWEPDWSNPITNKLALGFSPGKGNSNNTDRLYRKHSHPEFSSYTVMESTLTAGMTCNIPSPEGIPSLVFPANAHTYLELFAGTLFNTYFNSISGYAATVMWIGVPGEPSTYQMALAATYGAGGNYGYGGFGLALSADARQVRGFVASSSTFDWSDYMPLLPNQMNVAITSMPVNTSGGSLPMPTDIVSKPGLRRTVASGTKTNPNTGSFCVGSRGMIDGSTAESAGHYTYGAYLWARELSPEEKIALTQDPRIMMKRVKPAPIRSFASRVYDADLPLYTQVDDQVDYDPTDFMYTETDVPAILQLGTVDDPEMSTEHELSYTAKSTDGSGQLAVTLQQTGNIAALPVFNPVQAFTYPEIDLSTVGRKFYTVMVPSWNGKSAWSYDAVAKKVFPEGNTSSWPGRITRRGLLTGEGNYDFSEPHILRIHEVTDSYTLVAWINTDKVTTKHTICQISDVHYLHMSNSGGYKIAGTTRFSSSGAITLLDTVDIQANKDYIIVYRYIAGVGVSLFVNGVQVASGSYSDAVTVYSPYNAQRLTSSYGSYFQGIAFCALTDAEILKLSADPYHIFKKRKNRFYMPAPRDIATRTHTNVPPDWTEYNIELTEEEADLITDYSKLHVKLGGTP